MSEHAENPFGLKPGDPLFPPVPRQVFPLSPEHEARAAALEAKIDAATAVVERILREDETLRADYAELVWTNRHLMERNAELEARVAWLKKEHEDH